MKRFIFAVVLLSIACTLLSDEVMGSVLRKRRDVGPKPGCPKPTVGICVEQCGKESHLGGCIGGKICCFNGCGHTCVYPVYG
ncbi:hypothetical protein ACROYT_G036010 [Oculina patagonica]